jgi:predicted DNA-binding transcriptional regulator AlpA
VAQQLGTITIQAPTEPFLTASEVGRVFSVSGKTIERWAETGLFPPPVMRGRQKEWSNEAVGIYIIARKLGWAIRPELQHEEKEDE